MVGAQETVVWHRQEGSSKGITLRQVSWQGRQCRINADQRGRNGSDKGAIIEQGARLEYETSVMIPARSLPADYPKRGQPGGIRPGDWLLLGEGTDDMVTRRDARRQGRTLITIREVADNRYGLMTDHIRIRGY